MNILLLEDDELFASSLIDFLDDEGFEVNHSTHIEKFLDMTYCKYYDLYLLDINIPDGSGLDMLKDLRDSNDNTPAIFLTSYKDKETLKDGFKNGADDFITKPIDLDELMYRIDAILKRVGKQTSLIKIEDLVYNPMTKEIFKDNIALKLPIKVLELFELLYANRSKVVSKEQIIDKLWGIDEQYSEGSIRVYINKIKQLLNQNSVENIKGVGYKLNIQ
jgi:DNA-binding response OmpR family regulator